MPASCRVEWATVMIILMITIKAEFFWKVLAIVYFTEIKYLLEDVRSKLLRSVSTCIPNYITSRVKRQ
jgi:Na+/H+ antiporter NhaB